MAVYIAHLRAFPTNGILLEDASDSGGGSDGLQLAPLETFAYNDSQCVHHEMTGDEISAHYDAGPLGELERSFGLTLTEAHILHLDMGSAALISIFETRAPAATARESMSGIGSLCFRSTRGVANLVWAQVERLQTRGLIRVPDYARGDLLTPATGSFPLDRFATQMEWRAWGHLSAFEFGPRDGTSDDAQVVHDDRIMGDQCRIHRVGQNYYHWHLATGGDETKRILNYCQPLLFTLSLRSIIASAERNLRDVSEEFALRGGIAVHSLELRRYLSLVRRKILGCLDYAASSGKDFREVYFLHRRELDLAEQLEDLYQLMSSIRDTVEAVEWKSEAQQQARLGRFAFSFTLLSLISVTLQTFLFLRIDADAPDPGARALFFAGSVVVTALLGICAFAWGRASFRQKKKRDG